jgi:hydroxyacylglutathione hydrolase
LAARWPAARFAKFPWPERDRAIAVRWLPLADGQLIETPSGPLEVIHTPGHSPDHVALWRADSGDVFAGDLLVLGSTVVIPASHGGSLTAYLDSLARLDALEPRRAWPAHGPPIDDPRTLIAHYVAHRRQRERQVLDALAGGPVSIAEIAGRIYVGLEPVLVPQAHESVLAHLAKLEEDGEATRDGNLWRLR